MRSRLCIDLPPDLARATRVEAARRGVPVSRLAAEVLRQALGLSANRDAQRRRAAARTLALADEAAARRPGTPPVSTGELLAAERERAGR